MLEKLIKTVLSFELSCSISYAEIDRSIIQQRGDDEFDQVGKVVCPLADQDGGGFLPCPIVLTFDVQFALTHEYRVLYNSNAG